MRKNELISLLAEDTSLTKKQVESVLNSFVKNIGEELAKGEKIQIVGFGTFEVGERAARKGRNPKTGEEIVISASKTPKFKAGKSLKDMVNPN